MSTFNPNRGYDSHRIKAVLPNVYGHVMDAALRRLNYIREQARTGREQLKILGYTTPEERLLEAAGLITIQKNSFLWIPYREIHLSE